MIKYIFKKIWVWVCLFFLFGITSVSFAVDPAWKCVHPEWTDKNECINSERFEINTNTFTPIWDKTKKFKNNGKKISASVTLNNILTAVIGKMIVIFGVLSLLVMTIGGGFMIFYSGNDSLLTRGKSIFKWGLISLVIALSSGILVKIVAYLLYKT